ncbi:Serine/threonine-protein kinase pkn3 [Minicystis rosea]|nr:Serine/threonine-protein kinase pkn3 [Minicystis rosea]
MPAPPLPVQELDPEDLLIDEERNTSQTRRMGSNAQAALELELRRSFPDATPVAPPAAIAPGPVLPIPVVGAPVTAEGAALPRPYLAGDVIAGKYRLTRIIGRGGMGAVWQAHNIPLDIDVAIKLIRRDRTEAGAAERLLTEARAAARLMHPSIVRVFDFGESEQGDPFIVMELLHGESLSAILRRKKRLTPAVAVQTMLPVAAALVSAHGKGIVHRDLKPDNIIIVTAENGALLPKIVDFGIAKLLSEGIDRHVTQAGEVLGSPDYMSPEQARGAENVGEATDCWAFCVVLYELVAGVRPFEAANYNALIASILTSDPLPISAHGVNEGQLAAIIAQGLAKDVSARWNRMRDLGCALAAWAAGQGIEDDVTGNSIVKQWLAGGFRRLLTVMPDGMPVAASNAAGSSPAGAPPPVVETIVAKRRTAPRLLWIAPAIAVTALFGTGAWLVHDRLAPLLGVQAGTSAPTASAGAEAATSAAPTAASGEPAASAAPSASSSADAAPGSSADAAPGSSADAPAGSASAAPLGSARAPWPKGLRKNKGPQKSPPAPKNIRF